MPIRKLKRIEKIILIGFVFSSIVMVGFWIMDKKPDRDFFVPRGYYGWIRVEYSTENAEPLALKEGIQQIMVNDTGYAETSTELVVGWRRDRYFWVNEDGSTEQIPSSVRLDNDEYGIYLHGHGYYSRSYEKLLQTIPVGTDTTFSDGTHIVRKADNKVEYAKGRKKLEYFYLSAKPEPIVFNPPPIPHQDVLISTEDREISTK